MSKCDMPRSPIRPSSTPGRHPGGRTCAATLLGMLAAPWLLDVLLAGSKAVA